VTLRTDYTDTTPQGPDEHAHAHNEANAAINSLLAAVAKGTLPPGGAANDVLVKKTDSEGDVKWVEAPDVPVGGNADQVLTKIDAGDRRYRWRDPAAKEVGVGGVTGWLKTGTDKPTATAPNGTVFLVFDVVPALEYDADEQLP
jgi:hypothetical protein